MEVALTVVDTTEQRPPSATIFELPPAEGPALPRQESGKDKEASAAASAGPRPISKLREQRQQDAEKPEECDGLRAEALKSMRLLPDSRRVFQNSRLARRNPEAGSGLAVHSSARLLRWNRRSTACSSSVDSRCLTAGASAIPNIRQVSIRKFESDSSNGSRSRTRSECAER
jgi:hypothetical protein